MKKIVIATKDLTGRGGVVSYYRLFFREFHSEDFALDYFMIGSRFKDYQRRNKRKLAYLFELVKDLWGFHRLLARDPEIKIVQLSPSLIPLALFRDALFLRIARWHRRKVLIFFRGWRDEMVKKIDASFWRRRFFSRVFCRQPDACGVLARRFGDPLLRWGLDPDKLFVSYTAYDGSLVPADIPDRTGQTPTFVFAGRVSPEKGIDELIEASRRLHEANREFHVDVYGHAAHESYLEKCQKRLDEIGLSSLFQFHGYVDGAEKFAILNQSDIFVLPSWFEGCPNAVVEALGVGLFVIATPVGAIPELVTPGESGRLIPVRDAERLEETMNDALDRMEEIRSKRAAIRETARNRLEMGYFIRQFTEIYRKLTGIQGEGEMK